MKLQFSIFTILLIASLNSHSQKYKEGYLIFNSNKTQAGLIKYNEGYWDVFKSRSGSAKFKFSKSSKPIKIKNDVIGFVIEGDSFVIKRNIVINSMAPIFYKDFVKTEITGPINAFVHTCTSKSGASAGVGALSVGMNNIHKTWILCKGNNNCITISNPKKQEDRIIRFFSDSEIVKSKLVESKPKDWDIRELVTIYNKTKN